MVRIDPILCVAECTPITGSPGSLAAGVLAATAGLVLVAVRRRPRRDGAE